MKRDCYKFYKRVYLHPVLSKNENDLALDNMQKLLLDKVLMLTLVSLVTGYNLLFHKTFFLR